MTTPEITAAHEEFLRLTREAQPPTTWRRLAVTPERRAELLQKAEEKRRLMVYLWNETKASGGE